MSIRVTLCALFVIGFSLYAYRNWFVSLCSAIFLMAVLEHPDMPRAIFGISGLNLWNLLMINVLLAWAGQRRREGLDWDVDPILKIAFILYLLVVVVSFLRALINPTRYLQVPTMYFVIDSLVNPLKFLLPGLLLYDGCRTRQRVILASTVIMLLYFLLAVQVVRWMGIRPDLSGVELSDRAAKFLQRNVGYNRVDLSMMLAGASWAAVAFSQVFEKRKYRLLTWAAAGFILLAQSLTGGRMGYVTWGAVGLILCIVKWRRLLPVIPAAVLAVVIFVPGVAQRMLSGFGNKSGPVTVEEDTAQITSGRTTVWPLVIEKIKESPVVGYGRHGMRRTGLATYVEEELGDGFNHPHNAYFEILLDNGVIGAICIVPIFSVLLWRSLVVFRDRRDPVFQIAGGMAAALLLALLFGSFGAQTLYPREGVVGMWAALGIAARLFVERNRETSTAQAEDAESSDWQPREAPAA